MTSRSRWIASWGTRSTARSTRPAGWSRAAPSRPARPRSRSSQEFPSAPPYTSTPTCRHPRATGVGVRFDLERRRVGVREVHPQRPWPRRPGPTRRTCRRARGSARRAPPSHGPVSCCSTKPASSRRRTALPTAWYGVGAAVMKAARSCARSSIRCILPDVYDVVVVGAGSAGCALAGRLAPRIAGSVLLVEAGTGGLSYGRRRLAGRHLAGPLPQPGAPGRAGDRGYRRWCRAAGARGVGSDQRRGLDVRDARRRRGLGPPRLALPDPAVLVRHCRAGGPVRLRRADPGAGALGGAPAPERGAVPRRRGGARASRPSRTRTRAARPAPG